MKDEAGKFLLGQPLSAASGWQNINKWNLCIDQLTQKKKTCWTRLDSSHFLTLSAQPETWFTTPWSITFLGKPAWTYHRFSHKPKWSSWHFTVKLGGPCHCWAPGSTRHRTTSRCPFTSAMKRGVTPLSVVHWSLLAPDWTKNRTTSRCPFWAAM